MKYNKILRILMPAEIVSAGIFFWKHYNVGCAICGFSVGIMWPGTFSKASSALPTGGTAMFALLALAGDLGCSSGPTLVGFVSDAVGGNMKAGILVAMVFPVVMVLCLVGRKKNLK